MKNSIKDQLINEEYAIYNGDCMDVISTIPNDSIDLSIYSPPFAGLYIYSSDKRDMSNNDSPETFLQQYEYLIAQMARIIKPGRICAVHCSDVITQTTRHNLWDFPHEIIKLHLEYGFTYNNRITIWKEPLEVRMRTMVQSLTHKNIVEDSTRCFTAIPDYVLIFRKGGENKTPVTHENGLVEFPYFGDVIKNTRKLESVEGLNNNIVVNNLISIVCDQNAIDNFFKIKYVRWAGTLWSVSNVEVKSPRLILTLGGVYNGPTPATPDNSG